MAIGYCQLSVPFISVPLYNVNKFFIMHKDDLELSIDISNHNLLALWPL